MVLRYLTMFSVQQHVPLFQSHLRRNPYRKKEKADFILFYFRHNIRKTNLAEIFSEARSGTIAHKNKKRISAVTQWRAQI